MKDQAGNYCYSVVEAIAVMTISVLAAHRLVGTQPSVDPLCAKCLRIRELGFCPEYDETVSFQSLVVANQ